MKDKVRQRWQECYGFPALDLFYQSHRVSVQSKQCWKQSEFRLAGISVLVFCNSLEEKLGYFLSFFHWKFLKKIRMKRKEENRLPLNSPINSVVLRFHPMEKRGTVVAKYAFCGKCKLIRRAKTGPTCEFELVNYLFRKETLQIGAPHLDVIGLTTTFRHACCVDVVINPLVGKCSNG